MKISDFHGWTGIFDDMDEIVIDEDQRLAVFNSKEQAEKWIEDNTCECEECGESGVLGYEGSFFIAKGADQYPSTFLCFKCYEMPSESEYPDNVKDLC